MNIYQATQTHYNELIEVWEASVRATHHFLTEADILEYKDLILNRYFDRVRLFCTKHNGSINGFIGINEDMVQMLFIHPAARGTGAGKRLLQYVIDNHRINKVDVNEQNQQALGFYKYMGFEVIGRSEVDGAGKPYPILAMQLV
jgi:putative acetyltransferase